MSLMKIAAEEALKLPYIRGKERVGCVAFNKRGEVIATATNSYSKTHPTQAFYAKRVGQEDKIFLHAEISCIIKAQRQMNKGKNIHKIVVARVGAKGKLLPSKPCEICEMAITAAEVENVLYHKGD